MALGIYSGKDAYVNGVSCIQSWQVTEAVTAQRYSASCTPGGTNVAPGVVNWSGQMSGVGPVPAAFPDGVVLSFQGVTNNSAGEGDLLSVEGSALIEQLTIDINKETAAPISWQATFGFNGVPTEAASGAADAVIATPVYGDALDVRIGSSPATIVTGSLALRTAQIVFRRPLTVFVKGGAAYRKSGNLECDISFSAFTPSLKVTAFAQGTLAKTRIYTSATAYWEFAKIRFLGKSNFQVERGTVNVLGYQVNGQWNSADAGALGYITYFDGTDNTDYYGSSS